MFAVLSITRKMASRLVALFAIFWLAACEPVGLAGGGGPSVDPSQSVAVALLVPHGAVSVQEQALARDLERAARLAISDLQGVQIDLRVYATAGNAARAQEAARSAVDDGAKIIIGPLRAEAANAAAIAAASRNVNVLAFSNNATIAGGNLFILGQTFDNTAKRLTSFARRQGKSRVVTVYSNNVAGQLGKSAIEQAVINSGGINVGSVGYDFSQDGVVAAIPRITSAATSVARTQSFLPRMLPVLCRCSPRCCQNGA